MRRTAAAFEALRPRRVNEARAGETMADMSSAPVVPDVQRTEAPIEPETRPAEPSSDDNACARKTDEFALERFEAAVREEAIRFATIATARALRCALRDADGAVTRYVDDALRACGRLLRASVRLHPADAHAYRPQRGVDVAPDALLARGTIAIDIGGGEVAATIEERAELLVRAACA
ncbi:MAG: hypothetical protein JO219_09660 [Candidatus Eremiobacteraeota bacterium]|nr:hypothetical protein [Candidatus Eremiobacteraeota bacterium]MBV8366342.1 hypothetical protein [Candidatus Eremiobacteraeota bacterium]